MTPRKREQVASVRKVECRTHQGGRFTPPVKRGRPPVRCEAAFPCSAAETAIPQGRAKSAWGKQLQAAGVAPVEAQRTKAISSSRPEKRAAQHYTPDDGMPASLAKAKKAKAELEARGWTVKGTAKGSRAEITAARDDELLLMVWEDGVQTTAQYSLWSTEKPSDNTMPPTRLPEWFNVNEMSDRDVIGYLAGVKVTWWNRLGQREEQAIIAPEKISIEHVYNGRGDEVPADRIVKFLELGGSFKAFRLGALLKVGK